MIQQRDESSMSFAYISSLFGYRSEMTGLTRSIEMIKEQKAYVDNLFCPNNAKITDIISFVIKINGTKQNGWHLNAYWHFRM